MAADLQIPETLRNRIEIWVVQFKDHFLHLEDWPQRVPDDSGPAVPTDM